MAFHLERFHFKQHSTKMHPTCVSAEPLGFLTGTRNPAIMAHLFLALLALSPGVLGAGYPNGMPFPITPTLTPTTPAATAQMGVSTAMQGALGTPATQTSQTQQTSAAQGLNTAALLTPPQQTVQVQGIISTPAQQAQATQAGQGLDPTAIQSAISNAAGQAAAAVQQALPHAVTLQAGQTLPPAATAGTPGTPGSLVPQVAPAVAAPAQNTASVGTALDAGVIPVNPQARAQAGVSVVTTGPIGLPQPGTVTPPVLVTSEARPNPAVPGEIMRGAEPADPDVKNDTLAAQKVDYEVFEKETDVRTSAARAGTWWWSGKPIKKMER
jgi:hypothetical protein